MQGAYSVEEIRAAESELMSRLPPGALMQRAATALAVECARLLDRVYGARVVLLVGSGSNGGDALFAGVRLLRRGADVRAVLLSSSAHPAGLAAFRAAGGRLLPVSASSVAADLVVDGIVGIGGRGGLRVQAAELVAASAGLTVAVDLPSGVEADTGAVPGEAVRADLTVTFGALKPGLVCGPGAGRAGELRVADIGLRLPEPSIRVLERQDVAAALRPPSAGDDKYTRGVVGVIAGSPDYPGAGVLATGSAIHGGAGMVRYLGGAPERIRDRYPEVIVHEDTRPAEVHVQAWTVGPGIGTDDAAMRLLAEVLDDGLPTIIDADAITLVGQDRSLLRERDAPTVLTPHDREFARVAGEVGDDRIGAARRAARELQATVLLKGNTTVVADTDGGAFVNPTGTPWLATAGSGDVLSGLIGSLLAAGLPAGTAAAVGAYVHGVAGQIAAAAGPPSSADVLGAVRAALATVTG